MRRLLINADDFGLTTGINRAILEAHTKGVVTSTTLMANGHAFADAVRASHASSRLSVGCHVVLVDGLPLLSASHVPTLTNPRNPDLFRDNLSSFVLRSSLGLIAPEQIEAEATAQIRKLQTAGIVVSHVDSHKHTHLFLNVLEPLLRAAKACGVRAIRNPFGPIAFALVAKRPRLWKRYAETKLLNGLADRFRRTASKVGVLTPDGTLGIVATGALDQQLFRFMIENLPDGTWEFVCHPGYNDAELQGVRTRLRGSRELELQVLTSTATRELLAHNKIELISYRDLSGVT